ncbi:RNA 2',3'-cyclic phosphodiesterase [Leptolyngbya sp. 7M]|uniref:RNA 2',3'-cyclic phosphodiesterase n=1 Tax=Leptolyngbya sp. 7M TaxID=2812896 RepID=UPI001B8AA318|nr:RNA 2',3'-cyclic phosphodiesterase [Leptolyngbya sp. 7M]QYO62082.1 RNA 2',3'-cyclic phosphodiesterase [Leptolyngbya sp. 7M]
MKRIFAAIDISEESRIKAAEHIVALRDVSQKERIRWVNPELLHITLMFVGEIDERSFFRFVWTVENTAKNFVPFEIALSNAGIFLRSGIANVLWLGVDDDSGSLTAIAKQMSMDFSSNLVDANRRFRPHLTIARSKYLSNKSKTVSEHLKRGFGPINERVSEIVIYESTLLPQGPIYKVLSKTKLGT